MSNSTNLKEIYSVEVKHGPFYTGGTIQWSSNGENLFCQNGGSISVLSIPKGSVITTLGLSENQEDEDTINSFTLSPDNEFIISHHKSGLFKLWLWKDQKLNKLWKSIHKGPVPKIAFSPASTIMASGGSDSSIRLWDLQHHACTHNLKGHQGVVSVLKFHPVVEKHLLFAAGDDASIYSWDITAGAVKSILSGHFSKVTDLSFHEDGNRMVSSGRDKVLILWDINKGISLRTLPVYEAIEGIFIVPSIAPFPIESKTSEIYVSSAGEKGAVKIWDMQSGKEVYHQEHQLVQPAKESGGLAVTHLLFNQLLNSFVVVSVDHNIIIHSLNSFESQKQFVGFSDEILDIVYVGDGGSHLAVATNSCEIKLYELLSMSCQLLKGHSDLVLSLCVSPANQKLMISSAKDNSVRLWLMSETRTMMCIGSGIRHTASIGSVAISQASASFFVSVSQDQCLKLWTLPEKLNENVILNPVHTVLAHQKDINCAIVSPNDKLIATGSQDKTAKLWSSDSLKLLGTFKGHRRGVWCVRFSPIDQVLLTTSADCTIKIWSLSELNCLKTFEGHESSVLRAEFLSRGMQLITSGADGLLKLWNIKTSECIGTFEAHENRVWALAVKGDESYIVSGGADSFMVFWRDLTLEKKQEEIIAKEKIILEEQELANLLKANELVSALRLALTLEKPFQVLKIIEEIVKEDSEDSERLGVVIGEMTLKQKQGLLRCAEEWNTNSRNSHVAQLLLNALLNDPKNNNFPISGSSSSLEALIPYTERHFKRITKLLQDLHFLNYTVNCIKPHSASEFTK